MPTARITVIPLALAIFVISAVSVRAQVTAVRYTLTLATGEQVSFNELPGITSEIDPAQYVTNTSTGTTFSKTTAGVKPQTVTLRRSYRHRADDWTYLWHEQARRGDIRAYRDATLVMYDSQGVVVATYYLEQAFPTQLGVTAVNKVLKETVTLACNSLTRVPLQ